MKKILTLIIALSILSGAIAQDPGDLDHTFGIQGIASLPINFNNDLETISVLPDNSIITGGKYFDIDDYPLCISNKIDQNGNMLPYGSSGTFEYDFATGFEDESIYASTILPNGKIVLAGHHSTPAEAFIIQLFPDGSFDPSFSDDGIYADDSFTFKTQNLDVYGNESEYKIIICGTDNGFDIPQMLMIDQDGVPVSGFGTDGLYQLSVHDGEFTDIVIDQANNCFYACGYEWLSPDAFISKHNLSSGELIPEFGTAGIYSFTGPSNHIRPETILLSGSGSKLTVFGYLWHPDGDDDIFGIRLNTSDGSPDVSFGIDGYSTLRVPDQHDYIVDAVIQGDQKYYVGGRIFTESGGGDLMIGRIQSNGYADLTFGVAGFTLTNIDNHDRAECIALSNDESRIYAGGRSGYGNPYYTATIAAYHTGYIVGVQEKESGFEKMRVYPNPATEMITIETGNDDTYSVKVYDLAGKLLLHTFTNEKLLQVDLSSLQIGTYLLKLTNSSNTTQVTRVIKY